MEIIKTEALISEEQNLLKIMDEMEQIMTDIYDKIEKLTTTSWTGETASFFLNNFNDDYQKSLELHNTLKNNIHFLTQVSQNYQNLDNEIIKKLDSIPNVE